VTHCKVKGIRLTIILVSILSTKFSTAQKILWLENRHIAKRIKYVVGDHMSFVTKSGLYFNDLLVRINDSSLQLNKETVLIEDIDYVFKTQRGATWRSMSNVAAQAGLLFFSVDAFNRTINQEYPIIRNGNLVVTSSFLISSALFYKLGTRRYRLNKKWRLRVIDISI